MRTWALLCFVSSSSCLQAVTDEPDSGAPATTRDASIPGRVEEPPGRCDWDGGGRNLCQADTGVVFDGTACISVCTDRQPGEPGVFSSLLECRLYCAPDGGM